MLSITVDPAIVPNLARVFAVLACIGLSGFLLVYFAFGLRSPLAAAATAFPIGFAATLLVTNLLAYVLGTPRAFVWGLLAVLALALLSAFARRRHYRPLRPLSWVDAGFFVCAGAVVLFLGVVNYAVYPVWDYYLHFWLANTIRFGNFPVMAPGAPNLFAEYHYGGAFLAAMLAHFTQLDSAIVFFILTPMAATTAYLAAAMLAAKVLQSVRLGLLAGLFFSFGAGLPGPTDLLESAHLRWFPPSSAAARDLLTDTYAWSTPTEFDGFPLNLAQPHFLLAWGILLSVVFLASHLPRSLSAAYPLLWNRSRWVLAGVLYASVALIEVSLFALGLLGWGALALWRSHNERKGVHIGLFTLAATPAALLAVVQGGFLSAVFLHSPSGGTGLGDAFQVSLSPLSFLSASSAPHFPGSPPWAVLYLASFGVPLVAAPVAVYWTLRVRCLTHLTWLAAIGAVGMLLPHFVTYHYSSTLSRWSGFGLTSLSLLLGIVLLARAKQQRHRWLSWTLFAACAALTIGWPLSVSARNVALVQSVTLGQRIEDHWTVSPLHRQSDNLNWFTGRNYTFFMGAEAREFLRALPADARVLTNRFPEVPLLLRGFAPHKNIDRFSFTNFHYPGPTYFDALHALDPTAMADYGITHIAINYFWFTHTTPQTHALLRDTRFFSLVFTDEESHGGFAWHHVYEVLPAFYEESPSPASDLVRALPDLVPEGASIYISPAIPADIRWALLYTLREREISSATLADNHINARLNVAEPHPTDRYDFALLIDEPPGDRWLNWEQTPQDFPSAWGLHPSQRIWHTLGVGLYALDQRVCPSPTLAGVPPAWHVQANTTTPLDLSCLHSDGATADLRYSLVLTVLSAQSTHVEVASDGVVQEFDLQAGAALLPLPAPKTSELSVSANGPIWIRAQRVPPEEQQAQTGIPALLVLPTFDGKVLNVAVSLYGERADPLENQVVFNLLKQRRIYGHWWHWDSGNSVGTWRLMLDRPPTHGDSFHFALDLETLASTVEAFGEPTSVTTRRPLPANPGEPYVLYVTMFKPGERVLSIPVAWLTYAPGKEPTVLAAPRFILLDQASGQD